MKDKNRKTEFRYFSITQWRKEQEYLQKNHENGWRFTQVSGFGMYHFEKCEPESVVYQLDYNQEGVKNKVEYVQMFQDCGWEYIQDYYGYSYFRKKASQMNGKEEIFCDDESRIDMMKRVFKGRILPMIVIFLLCIVPNLTNHSVLGSKADMFITGVFGIFGIFYIILFLSFGYQFWRFRKEMDK